MILKKLKLKNFYGFSDYTFDYKPGIIGMLGHVGSGKSGFGEIAQYFALTGKTPPAIPSKEELISWGESTGYTELYVENDGIEYVMKRNLHNSSIQLTWTENGKKEKQTQKEANTTFEAMVGMSAEVLYECCFVRQGNLWAILTMSTSERIAYFQRITGTILAEKLRALLQKHYTNLPSFPDRSAEIEECNRIIDSNERSKKALEDQIKVTNDRIEKEFPESIEDVVGKLKGMLTEVEYNNEKQRCQLNASQARSDLDILKEKIRKELGDEPEEAEYPAAEDIALHASWQDKWVPASKKKDASAKAAEDAEVELQDIGDRINKIIEDRKTAKEREEKAVKNIADIDAAIYQAAHQLELAEKGVCPTCSQPYKVDTDDLSKKIEKLEASKKATGKSLDDLRIYLDNTETKLQEVEDRRKNLLKIIDDHTALMEVYNDPKFKDYDPTKLNEQRAKADAYAAYTKASRQFQDQVQEAQSKVDRTAASLEEAEKQKYLPDEDRVRLEQYRDKLAGLMQSVQQQKQRIAEVNAVITSQTSLRDSYQKDMDKQADVNRKRKLIEGARELLHRQRLPKVVMNHLRVALAYEVHQQLRQFDMPYQAELNEDFDYVIHWPDARDKGVHTLSGGQKVVLSICHHLALAKILADSVPLIFMDEPTNHLGDSEKSLVQKALYSMRAHAGRNTPILVATHEEQLYPAFNSMVTFTRKSDNQ